MTAPGFTIPNRLDAAFLDQADLDTVDLDIITGASAMTAVMYGRGYATGGLAVTPSSLMTLAVAAGEARIRGRKVKYSGGTVAVTSAASPRISLITLSEVGTVATVNGTASATPKMPLIPTSPNRRIVLAAVYIPASDTTIDATQITDKRIFAWDPYVENPLWYGALGDGSANDQPGCQLAYDAVPDDGGCVAWPDGEYKIVEPSPGVPGILVTNKAGLKSVGLPGKSLQASAGGATLVAGTDGMTLFKVMKSGGSGLTHSGPTFEHLGFEDKKPTPNPSSANAVSAHYNSGTSEVEFTWPGHTFVVGSVLRPFNFGNDSWNDDYETEKITAATWAAGSGTITVIKRDPGWIVGQWLVLSKNTPGSWDGVFQITARNATGGSGPWTFTLAMVSNPGAWAGNIPGQGGIAYKAWVVSSVVGNTVKAFHGPTFPGVADSTGQLAFEVLKNPVTVTLLSIEGPTRSYIRRCSFSTGKYGIVLHSINSTDVSWADINWCTFTECGAQVKIKGDGGHSVEIEGGDFALHTGQVGVQGPYPEESGNAINNNHMRVRGMKVDTRHSSGNGCWFIDSGPITRYYEFGPFNVEMEGDSRAIRAGGNAAGANATAGAKGGHGTIFGIGGQHNDAKGGACIELFGGSDTTDMVGVTIMGGSYVSWDTAIILGPWCQSVKVFGGNVTRGNTGIAIDPTTDNTGLWGFTSTVGESGYTHIDDKGTRTHGSGNTDDSPGSKHRLEGLGTTIYTTAPANNEGLPGELRLVNLSGVYWVYAKMGASLWQRAALTTSGSSGTPLPIPIAVFSKQGALATGAGTFRQYINGSWTISKVIISVGTAPVGASIKVDVNKGSGNGATATSVWDTTQANRATITPGNFRGSQTAFDFPALVDDNFLTVDIDTVGSPGTTGADLTVQVFGTPG